jgi:hypothetical protein
MKNIHKAYKDEITRAYGFIGKIKVWNSNREPDNKKVLKLINANFKSYRDIIAGGLDKTFFDRQMLEKDYKIFKFVTRKLTRAFVVKNFLKISDNTDLHISLFLDMGRE